jgi:hypothetical protein
VVKYACGVQMLEPSQAAAAQAILAVAVGPYLRS